jgi:hypothetical protein
MEELFTQVLIKLHFFATGPGVLAIGTVATMIFLLWEWRFALFGLFVIQLGVAALAVRVQELSVQTAGVQVLVMGLCTLMLGLSAQQMQARNRFRAPGSWLLRLMALLLLLVSWRLFDLNLSIPLLVPVVARLFVWLALCSLILLSLSDTPLFSGVALLLWCIPMQVIVEILVPGHSLFVLIGMMEIVLTLACSYLVLVDLAPAVQPISIPTDISFPAQASPQPALPTAVRGRLTAEPTLGAANRPAIPTEPAPEAPLVVRGSR